MSVLNSAYERKHVLAYGDITAEGLDCRMPILEFLERDLVAATRNHPSTDCRKSFDKCATYARVAASHNDDTIVPFVRYGLRGEASWVNGGICFDLSAGSHSRITSVVYRAVRQHQDDEAGNDIKAETLTRG
jgi:hypothetical protein